MRFKNWLETVQRPQITATVPPQIQYIDPEEDWELAGEVEQIANTVGIRFDSQKDVYIIATVNDEVIGGVADSTYDDDEEIGRVYSFDVVVHPNWQGYQNIGFKLIEAAIERAQWQDAQLISTHVVNTRLIPILINKYGFEGDEGGETAVLRKYI